MLSKFKSQIPKLMRNNKFSKIYLVLLLTITNIYLMFLYALQKQFSCELFFFNIFVYFFIYKHTKKIKC